MNRPGESDRPIVPEKPSNKGDGAPSPAEGAEGRGLAEENPLRQNQSIGRRAAPDWHSALERIRQAARRDKEVRFTALWHPVANVNRLREEYLGLKRDSVPGVDGQTWAAYGEDLEANLYLHYVFDLWADHWRRTQATGDVVIVRYADDVVVGFQHRHEAERFLADLRERFRRFNLERHPDKTRLFEFGRLATGRRAEKGQGQPETFDFLGFTHSGAKTRRGKFIVLRRPMKKRMRAKLKEVRKELRRRLHDPVADVGAWLRKGVAGWMRYDAVPLAWDALAAFRRHVTWLWWKALRRRSQKGRLTWAEMFRLANLWLPAPRIYPPYPWDRLRVRSKARAVGGNSSRTDPSGGCRVTGIPAATPRRPPGVVGPSRCYTGGFVAARPAP